MKNHNRLITKLSTVVVSLAMAIGVGAAASSNSGFREARAVSLTVTKSTAELATANGWENGTQYSSFNLDAHIAVSSSDSGNNGKYYSADPGTYRLYHSNTGTITISARDNDTKITSITLTYSVSNSGGLHTSSTNGANLTFAYSSGTAISLSEVSTFTAYAATKNASKTNGQVLISNFSVTYNYTGSNLTYSVSYNKNTDDNVSDMPAGHSDLANGTNQPLTMSPAPARWGYTFGGWAATAESSTPIEGNQVTINGANITVYAIWQKDLTIKGAHPETAYTVAEARAAIDAGQYTSNVYAKGTVSGIVTAYSDQYHNISYNISDFGFEEGDQLQAFRGKGEDGADFTSADDIKVGDYVIVHGNLKKHSTTYEFDEGNQLVERTTGRTFSSFTVVQQPTKTEYYDSQAFDPTGLKVNATFSKEPTTVDVTSLLVWPSLTSGMTSIKGSLTFNGQKKETPEIAISVSADTLDHIVVSGSMSKTSYRDSDGNFSAEGLTVTAHYASGHSAPVTENIEWSFSPEFAIGVTSVVATATYTENEVAKSASSVSQTVTVVKGPTLELVNADFTTYADFGSNGVTKNGIHFAGANAGNFNSSIQMKKTEGVIYNETALGIRIEKIEMDITNGEVSAYLGTEALSTTPEGDPNFVFSSSNKSYTVTGNYTYVRFVAGGATVNMNALSFWYSVNEPEISVSPSSFSFEQTDEGNVETTITKQYFGEQEVSYEATSSNAEVVADSSIQIENSVVSIAKANINVGTATITVNAKVGDDVKASTTFTVTCTAHNRIFISYEIKTEATKKVFDAGDTFDVTGLVVEGTFDAEPTKEDITAQCTYKLVDATGRVSDLVPGTTVLSGGTYSVKIVYGTTETLTYQINVLTIASIAVKTQPTKTSYRIGDIFDPTGLVLEGTKSDGTSKVDITEGFTCSTLDSTTAGQKTITVTYNGLTTTLTVTVVDNVYYSQIKDASDLKAGDKLLLVAANSDVTKVASGISGTNKYFDVTDVKIADGKILQTDAIESYELTLGGQAGAWTLANADGKLLGVTSAKGGNLAWVDASSETAHTWTISFTDSGVEIKIVDIEGGSLKYNITSPRFSNYTGTQNMLLPLLYKVGAKDPLAEKKAAAIAAIDAHVATLSQTDYSETGWAEITRLVSSAKEKVNAETKLENIDGIVTEFKANVAAVKTAAQEAEAAALKQAQDNACTELARYFQAINQEEYNEAGKLALAAAYDAGIASIKGTKAVADVATALANAKAALDAVEKQGTTPTEKTLTSIAVTTNPTKTTYNVGEQADYAGLVVTATYSDGSTEAIALASLTISGFSSSEAGTKTITVTYQGKTATFTVTVVDSTPAEDPLAEAKANAIAELETLVNGLNRADYSDEAWAQIQNALAEAKTAINNATNAEALNTLVANAKTTINAVKDNLELAKAAALSALEQYYNSFDKNNYDETGLASLRSAYNDGRDAIEAATNTDAVAAALANAKAALDAVATKPAAPAAKRCGGDIAATSIILSTIALAGVALLVLRKRKED